MKDDTDPLGGRHMFETLTRRTEPGQWDQLSPVSKIMWEHRAAGRPDFVPSTAVVRRMTQKIVNPIPAPRFPAVQIAPSMRFWRIVMPGGAKQIVKLAESNGWLVSVSYCNGPWSQQAEHEESEDGDDVLTKYGQADSVLVQGRRGKLRFAAMWLRRPWTKAGRDPAKKTGAGGYQFAFGQIRPVPERLVGASGGTAIGKDGKSHPVLTEEQVLANGKVNSDQLKQFIKGEEVT